MAHSLLIQNLKKNGNSITVEGKVVRGAKSFTISLGTDASNLLVYFTADLSNADITCKDKINGKYGRQQTNPSCPFQQDGDAKMSFTFAVTEVDTKVTVTLPDNTQIPFSSRLNLDYIAYVLVEGDFVVKSVTME